MVGLHGKDLGSIAEHSGVGDESGSALVCGHTCAHTHAPWVTLGTSNFPRNSPSPTGQLRAAHHADGHTERALQSEDSECRPFKQS